MENTSQIHFDNFTDGDRNSDVDWTDFKTSPESIPYYHRVIVASVLILVTLIGLLGNTIVIITVVVTKKLRTTTNILVVNLAFADLMTCICIPFNVVALLSKTNEYPLPDFICATVSGVTTTCICCSASTLAAIAVVRWYVITRSVRGHQGIHTAKKITSVVAILWIGSTASMVIPPFLGIGALGYSEYYSLCLTTDTNPLGLYYAIIQGLSFVIVLAVTMVFYFLLLYHILQHNKHFRDRYEADRTSDEAKGQDSSPSSVSRPPMIKAINRREIKITKNLFIVVCIFILCFLPIGVNLIIPVIYSFYGIILVLANSVVNPIVYGLRHPNFQEVFKNVLNCGRCSKEESSSQK
ncbi:rhodopsin, GQ-coupled-like [Lytechinus variegatus]|uniref:rhodopsin, GQ-coupled-like n=1 Tax=Lytechinus variegatus TaxID=7654 RepID=UPI001BB1A63A|nr:rhodopsin, GQ-coupled-like [Lytechinus variegatus]